MSPDCRDCRAGLDHCHGTVIHHPGSSECTEPDCESPEALRHTFAVDCDSVGCGCADLAGRTTVAVAV